MTAVAACVSSSVSPCPGQCLAHAATPRLWHARMNALAVAPTASESLPNARFPITTFRGLVLTSTTGARVMSTFTARHSLPTTSPTTRAARAASAAFPTVSALGMVVKCGSRNRATRPPS